MAAPPEHSSYQLRRVRLTAKAEAGYYYGFANEGMWPLCHIAHVRPTFRSEDWAHYLAANRKFAAAVVSEAKTANPIVPVQDYHFAICPWAEDILNGLLGSSILGFHTQFHCNNFVDTVDRLIEARVDRESFTVLHGGKMTAVRHYPISIAWPPSEEMLSKPVADCYRDVRSGNGLPPAQSEWASFLDFDGTLLDLAAPPTPFASIPPCRNCSSPSTRPAPARYGGSPVAARRPAIDDDKNDEHGFAAVNAQGGISIGLGSSAGHARYRLPDVAAVRTWLAGALPERS